MPLARAVRQVEAWGARVDLAHLDLIRQKYVSEERQLCRPFDERGVNPRSPKQLGEFFYGPAEEGGLGLLAQKHTPTGAPSTDADALAMLQKAHSLVARLLDYRAMQKFRATYCDGIRREVRDDGRLHTSYKVHGAATGRLSSAEPNLQNVPKRDKRGKTIRDAFIASPGCTLRQLDFSQLELRVMAALSGDDTMIGIYESGQDYHYRTAQIIAPLVWGIDPSTVEPKGTERALAKIVNFSLAYGKGVAQLAEDLTAEARRIDPDAPEITFDQAAAIKDAILGALPTLTEWFAATIARAEVEGGAWTYFNGDQAHFRAIDGLGSDDRGVLGAARRAAGNTPVQGSAGIIANTAVTECVEWIQRERFPAKVTIMVHDSILFDVEERFADELVAKARGIMESQPLVTPSGRSVPLVVDVEAGDRWGSLEEVVA